MAYGVIQVQDGDKDKKNVARVYSLPESGALKLTPTQVLRLINDRLGSQRNQYIIREVKNEKNKKKGVNLLKTTRPEYNKVKVTSEKTVNVEMVKKQIEVVVDVSHVARNPLQKAVFTFGRYQRIHTMMRVIGEAFPNIVNKQFMIGATEISDKIRNKSINYVMDLYTNTLNVSLEGRYVVTRS